MCLDSPSKSSFDPAYAQAGQPILDRESGAVLAAAVRAGVTGSTAVFVTTGSCGAALTSHVRTEGIVVTNEIDELTAHITAVIDVKAPQLLKLARVGQDSAAILLVTAGDNP
jgi:hypothetical protein